MAAGDVGEVEVGRFVRRLRGWSTVTGHPEPGLLADLACVIADGAPVDTRTRHASGRPDG